jgi:hypothetical protein
MPQLDFLGLAFGDPCTRCYFGQVATLNVPSVTAVPLPATLPLFATGLGALGLLGWRRKKKAYKSCEGSAL